MQETAVKVVLLAESLAERLDKVVPLDFSVEAVKSEIKIFHNNRLEQVNSLDVFWSKASTDQQNIDIIVSHVLDSVQDLIAEETREVWPKRDAADNAPRDLPLPYFRWEGRTLHMGFGDERDPVVRLEPLQLEELQAWE